MNVQFSAGDKVIVHASAFAAHSSKQVDRSASRPATIVREMPHSLAEYGHRQYEVAYDQDGAAGGDVIIHEDRITAV